MPKNYKDKKTEINYNILSYSCGTHAGFR